MFDKNGMVILEESAGFDDLPSLDPKDSLIQQEFNATIEAAAAENGNLATHAYEASNDGQ